MESLQVWSTRQSNRREAQCLRPTRPTLPVDGPVGPRGRARPPGPGDRRTARRPAAAVYRVSDSRRASPRPAATTARRPSGRPRNGRSTQELARRARGGDDDEPGGLPQQIVQLLANLAVACVQAAANNSPLPPEAAQLLDQLDSPDAGPLQPLAAYLRRLATDPRPPTRPPTGPPARRSARTPSPNSSPNSAQPSKTPAWANPDHA